MKTEPPDAHGADPSETAIWSVDRELRAAGVPLAERRADLAAGVRWLVAQARVRADQECRVDAPPPPDLLSRIDELCELASEARATLTQLDMQLAALREELQPGPRRVRVTLEGTHGWAGTVVGAPCAGLLVVRRDEDGVSFTVGERQVVDLTSEPRP